MDKPHLWVPLLRWTCIVCLGLIGSALAPIAAILIAHATLSDADLGDKLQEVLNKQLPGAFLLGEVHWDLPLKFTLSDARVDSPDGKPAIRVDQVDVQIHPMDLLHGSIQVSPVHVRGAHVWITQATPTSHVNLEFAFRQDPNGVEGDGLPAPWQVHLDDITVAKSEVLVRAPGAKLGFQGIEIDSGSVAIAGSALSVTAAIATDAELQMGKTRVSLGRVVAHTEHATLGFGRGRRDVRGKLVHLQMEGVSLVASGSMQAMAHKVENFDTRADVSVDIQKVALMSAELKELLHGQATAHVNFSGDEVRQHFKLNITGTSLAVHDVALESASVAGTLSGQDVLLREVQLRTNAGKMSGHGTLAINAGGVGAHEVHVGATDVALRRIAGPYVKAEGLLPSLVHAELDAKGPDLWPPVSAVTIHAIGTGIQAAQFPGVPDPMEIAGKCELNAKGIHILALQLLGSRMDYVVHGDVPWHPDSMVDVVAELCQIPIGRTLKEARLVYEPIPGQLKQGLDSFIGSLQGAGADLSQRIRATLAPSPPPSPRK